MTKRPGLLASCSLLFWHATDSPKKPLSYALTLDYMYDPRGTQMDFMLAL